MNNLQKKLTSRNKKGPFTPIQCPHCGKHIDVLPKNEEEENNITPSTPDTIEEKIEEKVEDDAKKSKIKGEKRKKNEKLSKQEAKELTINNFKECMRQSPKHSGTLAFARFIFFIIKEAIDNNDYVLGELNEKQKEGILTHLRKCGKKSEIQKKPKMKYISLLIVSTNPDYNFPGLTLEESNQARLVLHKKIVALIDAGQLIEKFSKFSDFAKCYKKCEEVSEELRMKLVELTLTQYIEELKDPSKIYGLAKSGYSNINYEAEENSLCKKRKRCKTEKEEEEEATVAKIEHMPPNPFPHSALALQPHLLDRKNDIRIMDLTAFKHQEPAKLPERSPTNGFIQKVKTDRPFIIPVQTDKRPIIERKIHHVIVIQQNEI
jgi:hypothetical protein